MSDFEDKIEHALKNINDPGWYNVSKRLRRTEIEGQRIGVALATNNKPQFDNFALNCRDLERLRNGKSDGKVDQIYVVATKRSGAGQQEYRGHGEANALYETKLRHRPTINGAYGSFWSLEPEDIEDEDAPF
jgi:hypothetical protein